MNRARVGRRGEDVAAAYLHRAGFRVLEQNYRCHLGEIDIVCQDSDTLVFVEVKARTQADFAAPWASIGPAKQRRLRRLAQQYMIRHGLESVPVRFDVVSVVLGDGRPAIEHITGAF
jgi:putative endonuclease